MFPSLLELYQRLGEEEHGKIVIENFLGKLEQILKESNLFDEYKQTYMKRCQKPGVKDPWHVNAMVVFDHYQNSTSGSNHSSQTSGILKF